ncbi:uncharacterized protein BYT42DRAFT_634316 [Radiomyces spectabilis]|uniref:uncharacterized protein n=1 Tax=Radiomyces spectabilis TaxID=64574 RepID=UPI00221F422D|nr:uncharacterized protein BYT42DRAFT_634316 [Radiomyces spectabilis]KAI8381159.1 hypothetical protein BYT42DRAFT_634316 [Radiomyces spectabilis]
MQQGINMSVEEHMQHLLALSCILLLKPACTHQDLHKHIDLNTCDTLCQQIIQIHRMTNQSFPSDVKLQLEDIMMQLDVVSTACTRLAASRKIWGLIQNDDVLNPVNRILLSIRNMVERLPRHIFENGPKETELITRHLEAILSPLTSVSDDEKQANIRPDASINIIHGAMLGNRIGCGEVKAQYQALNHRLIGIDLFRVATFAKDASDKHKLKSAFAFLVVGKVFVVFDRSITFSFFISHR